MLCHNVYGPAGNKNTLIRRQHQLEVLEEVLKWGEGPQMIVGDFNEPVTQTLLAAELIPRGWRIPLHGGDGEYVTYRSGSTSSWLDSVLLSPKFDPTFQYVDVRWIPRMSHATAPLKVDPQELSLKVSYPSRVWAGVPTAHTPVDWRSLSGTL